MPSGRMILCITFIRIGAVAFLLLFMSACATAPLKTTPLSPEQVALPPAPRTTPQPVAMPEEIQPATLHPAETTAMTLPAVVDEQSLAALAPTESVPVVTAAEPDYYQSIATYYAKRFKGRRTASGERYDPTQMTAATRDFPLQSWLKVINPANGKEVTVRVNDRTGKRKTPLIDLSRAAAKELGFLGKGKIRVHVIPLPSAP